MGKTGGEKSLSGSKKEKRERGKEAGRTGSDEDEKEDIPGGFGGASMDRLQSE